MSSAISIIRVEIYIYNQYNVDKTISGVFSPDHNNITNREILMRKLIAIITLLTLHLSAQSPSELLKKSGVTGGIVVHLGCDDAADTVNLGKNPQFCIHALTTSDPAAARKLIHRSGNYGRISANKLHGNKLPYADNLINILIAEDANSVSASEIMRVLTPLGKAYIKSGDSWKEIVKPWPENMDQWTHFLHGADNNAVSSDENIGAPRSLRWVGTPRWGRSHEEMASMSTAVSSNGRLFFINDNAPLASIRYLGDWHLIARDAFNGAPLWEKPISKWVDHLRHFRSGPTHISRRLTAVGDRVFVTLGFDAPVTCLDAATGKTIKIYKDTEFTEEIVYNNNHLYLMVGTSERIRRGGGLFERNEPAPTEERNVVAVDAESGNILWKKNACNNEYVMPLSLTARGDRVYYHSIKGIHCVDAASGEEIWLAEKQTVAKRYSFSTSTLVISDKAVLLADRKVNMAKPEAEGPADGDIEYGVHGWNEPGYIRKAQNQLTAYDIRDGKQLWSTPCAEGYNSPVDVFVIDNTVWVGSGFTKGYDLTTGEVKKQINTKGAPVGMAHHRCYRNKATPNYILTGRDGIETIDIEKGWTGNNSWIRGTCQYGILPANGLIYAPPNACACHPKVKMQGMVAVSADLPESSQKPLPGSAPRLIKGPAFERITKLTTKTLPAGAWSQYRNDNMRSGSAKTVISGTDKIWEVKLGNRLTQPVSANGMVYVASTDKHTVYALNSDNGKTIWTFTAGGRIDSSPSLYKGLIIFGCTDGWVYCLVSSNGEEAWRFQAAPEDRLISIFGQLESSWPVHGAILVQNDEITFTAGRNTYLDGGIYFYRMNPATGKVLAAKPIRHLDPTTGKQTGKEGRKAGLGFDSEGTASDILSGNGSDVFLKHMRFNTMGEELPPTIPHLFCQTGFIGEETFVRSYWVYGTNVGAGWGGWATMMNNNVRIAPSGRILAFDDNEVYGYGRIKPVAQATGHRANKTHFFASIKEYKPVKPAPQNKEKEKKGKKKNKAPKATKTYKWHHSEPFIARAIVLTEDNLYIAGIPDAGIEDTKEKEILQFTNNEEALSAFKGTKGAYLQIFSKEDGTISKKIKLEAPPVFDGMSAAEGKLFISQRNDKIVCFGK